MLKDEPPQSPAARRNPGSCRKNYFWIIPHAMRAPEFPAGSDL